MRMRVAFNRRIRSQVISSICILHDLYLSHNLVVVLLMICKYFLGTGTSLIFASSLGGGMEFRLN